MTVRVGLMGAGWVAGARHLPSFKRDPRADLVAVFDRNPTRAQAASSKFEIGVATDDVSRFFDVEMDVVVICTSPWSHAELAIEALERGHHVLTEKPMAMNSTEAHQMAEAAGKADRLLCVSHNFLFSRAVARADKALSSAGRIRYVNGLQLSSDLRRLPVWYEDLPGGLLFDEVPHLLYMLQHYLGELQLEGVRVSQRTERGHPAVLEIQVMGAHGPGQVMVVMGAPVSEWHVTVVAEQAVADLDLFRDISVLLRPDGSHGPADILRTSGRALLDHGVGFVASGALMTANRLFWGHDVLIGRFLDSVLEGSPPPVSLSDAVGLVELTDDVLAALS